MKVKKMRLWVQRKGVVYPTGSAVRQCAFRLRALRMRIEATLIAIRLSHFSAFLRVVVWPHGARGLCNDMSELTTVY